MPKPTNRLPKSDVLHGRVSFLSVEFMQLPRHPRFVLWYYCDLHQRDVVQNGGQKKIGPSTTGNVYAASAWIASN